MNVEVLFETKLIDSTKYLNLKWVRYSLYFLLLFIAGILIEPRTQFQGHISLQERLGLDFGNVVGIFLIIGTIAGAIYFYSIQFEEKGQLRIFTNGIEIKNQFDRLSFKYHEIEHLKISRGATYHYEYQRDNYLHEANNWLSFKCNEEIYEYEFIIDSLDKNKEFEKMINEFRKKRIKCKYLSI